MPETPHKFFLTTPIYYVNARPHIGHAYSTIAADVIARRHRLLGDDTFFLTGTDEHGQKVQRSAEKAGIPPQQFTDEVSGSFRSLWKRMGILDDSLSKNDPLLHRDFIRTTEERHKRGVQHLWRELEARGAIYLSSYTGQYCVSEEMFVEGPPGTIGPDGKPTETVTEENYFFRLSDYQLPLLDLIESGQLHIQPETTRNEVLSFLRGAAPAPTKSAVILTLSLPKGKDPCISSAAPQTPGAPSMPESHPGMGGSAQPIIAHTAAGTTYVPGALKDLSISRTSFTWGIPVPASDAVIPSERSESRDPRISPAAPQKPTEKHVVYVWLDALANYMTAVGYGSENPAEQAKFARYWPADLHLVGKEITRFHCLYWPAFLLALNPKLQHGPNEPMPQITPAEHAAWAKDWLPKSIVANGWLLFEESKMSKSRGNVVRTETILDAFGPLCPPVPIAPTTEAVIPSERSTTESVIPSERSESRDPRISLAAPQTSVVMNEACTSNEAVILSKGVADAESKDPDAAGPTNVARPFLPQTSAVPVQPTKAQQDLFAADVLRYFLLREIPFGQDGTFSFDALITRYNADLANGYGNLVSRTLAMINQYLDSVIPFPGEEYGEEFVFLERSSPAVQAEAEGLQNFLALTTEVSPFMARVSEGFESFSFNELLSLMSTAVAKVDLFLASTKPWILAKGKNGTEDSESLAVVLYTAAESIRIITALLYPILPYATTSVWRQLGLGDIEEAARNGKLKDLKWGGLQPGTKLGPLAPIFPRADKGLAQIMTEMESPAAATPEAATPVTPTPAAASEAQPSNLEPRTSDLISIDDFAKVDLRVAQIVVAERIPKADKLLRLEVDLGPNFNPSRRQILAGIAEYYTPESLIGRKVVIVANLAPRKMRGLESQGMIVAASIGPAGAPVLAGFLEDVELGARLK
jgi:methionyl-tRNA synthetase